MPDPVMYEAPQEYLKTLHFGGKEVTSGPPPLTDSIRTFESTGNDVDGTIRHWMTLDVPTKRRILSQFSAVIVKPTNQDASSNEMNEYQVRVRNRWRTLNYIIQEESYRDGGNRDIASLAFGALFPATTPAR